MSETGNVPEASMMRRFMNLDIYPCVEGLQPTVGVPQRPEY